MVKQTLMNTKQQLQRKLVTGSKQTWQVVCEAFALFASTHDATEVFQLQLNADINKEGWQFATKQSGGLGFSAKATQFVLDLGRIGKVRYITESHVKRAKMILGTVERANADIATAHRYFEIIETPTRSKVKAHKGMFDYTVKFRNCRQEGRVDVSRRNQLLVSHDIETGKANLTDVNNKKRTQAATADKKGALMYWDSAGNPINVTKARNDADAAVVTYSKAEDNAAGEKSEVKAREKLGDAISAYRAVIKKAIEDHNHLIDNCSGLRADRVTMPDELS